MSALEDEYAQRINELETENIDLKGRLLVAEKQVAEAKISVQSYTEELKRIAASTQEMLKGVAEIQKCAERRGRRLGKVQIVLFKAERYISGLEQTLVAVNTGMETDGVVAAGQKAEKEYLDSRKLLETSDDGEPTPAAAAADRPHPSGG